MTERIRQFLCSFLVWVGCATSTFASVPVHIVKSDLKPLIRAAVESPVQFAVLVPHAVSTSSAGTWTTTGQRATWSYAAQVPSAVSLSFHASQSSLPESARLTVRGSKTITSYGPRDLHRGELWSRIQPGDALEFSLTVELGDRQNVSLNIVSLQAGYRALGSGVSDHPYYRNLMAQANAGSGNSSCVTNYECKVNPSIAPQGSATVALVIEGLYQCTGVLINDVPGDNAPYLLTARHCETGNLGGGNPGAAAAVTVYWDATTACGAATLGSIYDPGIAVQTGAQTIVEQQDAWLIELDANPIVTDAQFAGFDASGTAVQGGYTVQHSESYDKQFTAWFGQAAQVQRSGVLGSTYVSNLLETVNSVGNIGPGASGSALFDQNHHLVGSLTLGRQTSDTSGYGSCPVASPPTPNGTNGVADFTSLAAVWNSTADTSSSTGNVTIKSALDPNNTGTLVTASGAVQSVSFSASVPSSPEGQNVQFVWNAPGATACTASGGIAGDGWSGPLAASGTRSLTESSAGPTPYNLSCVFPGGRTAKTSTSVYWLGPTPLVQLVAPYAVWTARPATLSWTSNLAPCSITGGLMSLNNLPAAGTTTTTQAVAGDVTYTLTCGPVNDQGSSTAQVMYVTPSLILEPTGTDRILGQTFMLHWQTYADSCVGSGGALNDGWGSTAFNVADAPASLFSPHVTTLGTYTYTLTCSSGDISVAQSVTVKFENDSPYVTASLTPLTVTYSNSPADYVTLNWNSNMSTCLINSDASVFFGASDPLRIAYQAQGMATAGPSGPGTFAISVTCALPGNNPTFVTSAPIMLTVLPPPAPTETISITPSTVVEGQSFTVSWSSTNASHCEGAGGIPLTGWDTNGTFALPPAGSYMYTPGGGSQLGQFNFTLTCESISPNSVAPTSAQAQLIVKESPGSTLAASLQTSASNVTIGNAFVLTWSSIDASDCTASGGGADGTPWSGSIGPAGSQARVASVVGTFSYTLVCSNRIAATSPQSVSIVVAQQSGDSSGGSSGTGSSGGSGGSGGGGSLGGAELVLLSTLLWLRSRHNPLPAGA
jgi:lysyl endopeptidase